MESALNRRFPMLPPIVHHVRRGAFTLLEVLVSISILAVFAVGVTWAILQLNDYAPRTRNLTSADNFLWSQIGQALVLNYNVGSGTTQNPAQLAEILKTDNDAASTASNIVAPATFNYPAGTYTFTAAVKPPYRSVFVPSFEEFDGQDYASGANPFGADKAWQVSGVPIFVSATPSRADLAASPDRLNPVVPGTYFRQVTLTDTLPGSAAKFSVSSDATKQVTNLGIRVVDVAVTYSYHGRATPAVRMTTFRAPN